MLAASNAGTGDSLVNSTAGSLCPSSALLPHVSRGSRPFGKPTALV